MKTTTFVFSLLSVAIPLAAYAFFFLAGLAPARLSEPVVYAPMFFSNAAGFAFGVIVLSRSNQKPIDTSSRMHVAVLLGTIAMFANTIAVEVVVYTSLIHTAKLQ